MSYCRQPKTIILSVRRCSLIYLWHLKKKEKVFDKIVFLQTILLCQQNRILFCLWQKSNIKRLLTTFIFAAFIFRYPTNKWVKLGTFHALDERTVQSFPLDEQMYAKYVKVNVHVSLNWKELHHHWLNHLFTGIFYII